MFLPAQQNIVCDLCSYDEVVDLYEMGDNEWKLDIEELENMGWLILNDELCYCSDCRYENG